MFLSYTLLFAVISFSKQEKMSKVVDTTSGSVRGYGVSFPQNRTVYQYLGIPYAKATRFEYPREDKWTEIFNATQHGKTCPQKSSPFGIQHLGETSENCLNLNIFVPDSKQNNLTVLVYIGGLLYSFGKANGTRFDPLAVASRGEVILVSLNYRLGILGFLSTEDEVIKGNYGLADQIEALNWLQRNIYRFGGNPDDVTVVGHWSGAMSVGLLLVSPKARGLFKHAILMSGSPLSLTATLDHVTAVERARKISEQLKCTNRSNLKACLKSKSVSDVISAQEQLQNVPILSPFAPVVDGEILTGSPDVLFNKSNQIKVKSVMIGMVEDDGAIFLSPSLPGVANNIGSVDQGINQSALHHIIKSNKLTKPTTAPSSLISHKYTNWKNPSIVFKLVTLLCCRNPTPQSIPLPLKWPKYAPNDQYLSIGESNISVQSKFLPDRVTFWNELLPLMMSQSLTNTPQPTVSSTPSSHDNGNECLPKKDKTTKALTAVVAVMAIVIVVMLAIIIYQTRMLSKRQDTPPSQPEH